MSIKEQPPQQLHIPVLLDKTLELLSPNSGENYLDLTAGYGGHAGRILEKTGNYRDSVLVDRDDYAISRLSRFSDQGVNLMHTDFVTAAQALQEKGTKFDIILVDLGVSSPQLDQNERGFSFKNDGPLDMRMDRRQEVSAQTLINTASAEELARIIRDYGEEPFGVARQIAASIVGARPLNTTRELAELIENTVRRPRKKIHPATRTFQAIRMAVNQELRQIELTLPILPKLLKPGGRLGVISFHSLEDRLVKRYFAAQSAAKIEAEIDVLTKKPLDGATYDVHNPRSRSAKLRVAVKK